MPAARTVFCWLARNEQFRSAYEVARGEQAYHLFEQMRAISEDSTGDYRIEGDKVVIVHDNVHRARLRKFYLSKLVPKVYGERSTLEHVGADGGPIQTAVVDRVELARWMAFTLQSADAALASPAVPPLALPAPPAEPVYVERERRTPDPRFEPDPPLPHYPSHEEMGFSRRRPEVVSGRR